MAMEGLHVEPTPGVPHLCLGPDTPSMEKGQVYHPALLHFQLVPQFLHPHFTILSRLNYLLF